MKILNQEYSNIEQNLKMSLFAEFKDFEREFENFKSEIQRKKPSKKAQILISTFIENASTDSAKFFVANREKEKELSVLLHKEIQKKLEQDFQVKNYLFNSYKK